MQEQTVLRADRFLLSSCQGVGYPINLYEEFKKRSEQIN